MRVEIWSDVVCPWCYIGKRKFEAALASFDGRDDVEVVWRPFQLDPGAPRGGTQPVIEAYARKFGGPERAARIIEHVSSVAADAGLEFRMDRALRANTLDAHRLLWLAQHEGSPERQDALKERLLRAYFMDGSDVADRATLVALAAEVGLDRDRVTAFLAGDEGVAETRAEIARAGELEIHSVPTFVFDGRWQVPGAQEPEVFARIFERVLHLEQEAALEAAGAASTPSGTCDADTCAV